MKLIAKHFPNAQVCYLSARHTTAFMPDDEGKKKHAEPRPYQMGWGVKWYIESPSNGQDGPLATWATYFWTEADQPRSDGYHWTQAMNVADGVHLTEAGSQRVARELCEFWSGDSQAKSWFVKAGASIPSTAKPTDEPAKKLKPQVVAAENLKPGDAALLINGKSKFAKLERLLATDKPVRLVVYDVADNREILRIEDVFRQRIDLNEKLGAGEYRLHFLDDNDQRLPMTMAVPDVLRLK